MKCYHDKRDATHVAERLNGTLIALCESCTEVYKRHTPQIPTRPAIFQDIFVVEQPKIDSVGKRRITKKGSNSGNTNVANVLFS